MPAIELGEIRTGALLLRPYRLRDLDGLASVVGDPRVMERVGGPLRSDEIAGLLDRYMRPDDPRILVALAVERAEDGAYVGHGRIVPCEQEDGPEIGYLVHPDHQGRGIATEIARTLLDIARDTLRARRVYATVDLDHAASIRVLQKVGFVPLRTCRDDCGDFLLLQASARAAP